MSKQTVNRFQTPQALVTIDAVTCAATGMLFLLWSQPIAQWTALPPPPFAPASTVAVQLPKLVPKIVTELE